MAQWFEEPYFDRIAWILDHFDKLQMDCNEGMMVLLIEFFAQHRIQLDYQLIAEKLKMDEAKVDEILSGLMQKGYLEIKMVKADLVFDISGVFTVENVKVDRNLFDLFESEFKRTLSEPEVRTLSEWIQEYDLLMIQYALREAILRDVLKFSYIGKILSDWQMRGLSVEQLERGER